MSQLHPKVLASTASSAAATVLFAIIHLCQSGHLGVDDLTLSAAVVTVVQFVAGYLKA